jgi:cyclopropane fatty-acyl-phospholipid synthase-like methyltransferase
MLQADNLRPITTRLLREIGLAQGMRVVDLGCGAGDVAMLAAEMVGPTGAVLGSTATLPRSSRRASAHAQLVAPISSSWKAMPPK